MRGNPPFNVGDWSGKLLRGDKRWTYGDPPVGNANYAWIQHFIHNLAYLRTELMLRALDMALAQRHAKGVINPSDQGCCARPRCMDGPFSPSELLTAGQRHGCDR
ncbi:N-6 DNA methylase [Burkholderia stabilis]|uniref:N-6 DNA methylase n=1 Tax=Burkholderia stabilis TaxID=95485 RepID=UPI003B97F269